MYAQLNAKLQNIETGTWEEGYTDEMDRGFLYLKFPVEINMTNIPQIYFSLHNIYYRKLHFINEYTYNIEIKCVSIFIIIDQTFL